MSVLSRVHSGHRLVEHQQTGPGRERPADLEPALLAVGQVAGVDVTAPGQPDELEQLVGCAQRALLVFAGAAGIEHRAPPGGPQMQVHPDQDVLDGGDVSEQADVLVGAIDPRLRHRVGRDSVDPLAVEPDLPAVRRVERHDAVEHRGLAGAVRPDDAVDAAFGHREIQAVDRDQPAETLGEPVADEDRFARHAHPPRRAAISTSSAPAQTRVGSPVMVMVIDAHHPREAPPRWRTGFLLRASSRGAWRPTARGPRPSDAS